MCNSNSRTYFSRAQRNLHPPNSRSASTGGSFEKLLRRYVTSNPAPPTTRPAGNAYNVADLSSLLHVQAVRNGGENDLIILGVLSVPSAFSPWVDLLTTSPRWHLDGNGLRIANVAASSHSYDLNRRA